MTWTNHEMVPHPTTTDLDYFLTEAMRIAQGADQILLEGYGQVTAHRKVDGSLVTETDQAVDVYVTSELTRSFPQHAVLSEELNTSYNSQSDYTWVIDPLDGTTNFARGLPIWGSSFALLFQGLPVLGLLGFVSLREQYWAILGQGAYLNGVKIATGQNQQPDTNHFMMQCTRTQRRYRVTSPLKQRILGSAAYHIAAVAKGAALAGIEATPKLWDIAAALLILTEAGGTFKVLGAGDDIFPLRGIRMDYKDISFPLVTAANAAILGDLENSLSLFDNDYTNESSTTLIIRKVGETESKIGYVDTEGVIYRLRWDQGIRVGRISSDRRVFRATRFDERESGSFTEAGAIRSHGLFEGGELGWVEADGTVVQAGLIFGEEEVGRVVGVAPVAAGAALLLLFLVDENEDRHRTDR